MNRRSRALLVLIAGAVAFGSPLVTPAEADPGGWDCWSDATNQPHPEGTEVESPTVGRSGLYVCRNGRWEPVTPKNADCHIIYGGWTFLHQNQTWVKHGESTMLRGRRETCQNGTMIPAP
jgi:hypothetical protein